MSTYSDSSEPRVSTRVGCVLRRTLLSDQIPILVRPGRTLPSGIRHSSPPAPIVQQRGALRKPLPWRLVRDERGVHQPVACAPGSEYATVHPVVQASSRT